MYPKQQYYFRRSTNFIPLVLLILVQNLLLSRMDYVVQEANSLPFLNFTGSNEAKLNISPQLSSSSSTGIDRRVNLEFSKSSTEVSGKDDYCCLNSSIHQSANSFNIELDLSMTGVTTNNNSNSNKFPGIIIPGSTSYPFLVKAKSNIPPEVGHIQTNILKLIKELSFHLNVIRNDELGVTYIQEMFDAMGFIENEKIHPEIQINQFSRRLAKKLENTIEIIRNLKFFFNNNITKLILNKTLNQSKNNNNTTKEEISTRDYDVIKKKIHLKTIIYPCFSSSNNENEKLMADEEHEEVAQERFKSDDEEMKIQDYDGDKIQILNYYLKKTKDISNALLSKIDDSYVQNKSKDGDDNYNAEENDDIVNDKDISSEINLKILNEIKTIKINGKMRNLRKEENMTRNDENISDSADTPSNIYYFKNIYFLSHSDYFRNNNNNNKLNNNGDNIEKCFQINNYFDNKELNSNFHSLYMSAIKKKYVLILLDYSGNKFNAEQLELSKRLILNIINLLNDNDHISIVTIFNNDINSMILNGPKKKNIKISKDDESHFYSIRMEIKDEIKNFINHIEYNETMKKQMNLITNHKLGFEYAFELLRKENLTLKSKDDDNDDANNDIPIEFIYITRGLLNELTDGYDVLKTISNGQSKLRNPIKINVIAVVVDEGRMMYEKQFLRDIAMQNYTKYDINISSWYNKLKKKEDDQQNHLQGNFLVITRKNSHRILEITYSLFEHLFRKAENIDEKIKFHYPVIYQISQEGIISLTTPVKSYGLIGIDMFLTDLAEDIIYYKNTENNYAFLIDKIGTVIYHQAFSRSIVLKKYPYPTDISLLEDSNEFILKIRGKLLNESSGKFSFELDSIRITYFWRNILNIYVICIVTKERIGNLSGTNFSQFYHNYQRSSSSSSSSSPPLMSNNNINSGSISSRNFKETNIKLTMMKKLQNDPDILYHRIDLIPPLKPICRYFRQVTSFDCATVYFSPSSFQSPFIYLKNNHENQEEIRIHNAQSIMAYIKDVTNLLANPGLLPQIRDDVTVLYPIILYLKRKHQENGPYKNYIIRRYISTINGVIQIYPGSVLNINLEPSKRPWFKKAISHPGKTIITEPYLDATGAGYIVTIAYTIFEGKPNALHDAKTDKPITIVALDVTASFFYKLILNSISFCHEPFIKCLLFENEGYLVAHPSVMEPPSIVNNNNKRLTASGGSTLSPSSSSSGGIDGFSIDINDYDEEKLNKNVMRKSSEHITHKESFLANDMLNHKNLVKKKSCIDFQNRIVQRFYAFNTSLMEILTNYVCEKIPYQVTLIPGTNLFVAVVNTTNDGGAFCPCSTTDKICLNCNRMDTLDCECPCECPLNFKFYSSTSSLSSSTKLSYCEPPYENFCDNNNNNPLFYDWNMLIKSCINIKCDTFTTHLNCLGVMGCEWCQTDLDGNPFLKPFCASQSSCFNGILGSLTPYGDGGHYGRTLVEPSSMQPAYPAIIPVGGAVIALLIIVGFAMYCYKHNIENNSDQLYGDSLPDENHHGVSLSRFNFDDISSPCDENDLNNSGPGNSGGKGSGAASGSHLRNLQSAGNIISVSDISSPYHVSSSGYRRTPNNGESDNGYSTMTPHEDSEHMCFALVEPLINNSNNNNGGGGDSERRLSISDSTSIGTSVSSPCNQHHHQHQPMQQLSSPTSIGVTVLNKEKAILTSLAPTTSITKLYHSKLESPFHPKKHYQYNSLPNHHQQDNRYDDNCPPQTNLSSEQVSPHRILAPVTVHRDMEASS